MPKMQDGRRRNVLLIVADSWRADCISALGHPTVRTPNLDSLAEQGVLFTRQFTQAVPCGPARASLLSGRYLMNHRVVANGIPASASMETMPRLARRAGYTPALIGYTSSTPDPRVVDEDDPRFRNRRSVAGEGWEPVRCKDPFHEPYLQYLAEQGHCDFGASIDEAWATKVTPEGGYLRAPSRIPAEDSDTAFYAKAAIDFVRSNAERPWFLHFGLWRPHPPYVASDPFHSMYQPQACEAPVRHETAEAEAGVHPYLGLMVEQRRRNELFVGGKGAVRDIAVDEARALRATYFALVSEVDAWLGNLFAELKRTGQWDDTLILFTSDHGDMLGDHHFFGPWSSYDPAFRVPLIVRDPRPEADAGRGRREARFTEAVDILPTILDWLEEPIPRTCDGRSLLPLVAGAPPADWRDGVVCEFDFRDLEEGNATRSVLGLERDDCAATIYRNGKWKYVHFSGLRPMLFDIEADPHEMHDLSGDPAAASVMLELAQALLSHRLRQADRSLTGFVATSGGLVERS